MKVVVGIKKNGSIIWFWGEEELWFLDLRKVDSTVINENALNMRKGFEVLNCDNILTFLDQNGDHIVTTRELLQNVRREDLILYPTLFIDFDDKKFYDDFPEPDNYELAIPDGWTFTYDDFTHLVEEKDRYWI